MIGFILVRRKQIELRSDVSGMKMRGANKESQKRLKTARKYLESNEDALYYDEVAKALWGYVADKFTTEQVDLTTDKIKERLLEKHIDESLIDKLIQVLQRCEFARFAPAADVKGKEDLPKQETSFKNLNKKRNKHETIICSFILYISILQFICTK